jgi:hypothetical protein
VETSDADVRWKDWDEWRSDAFYHVVDWAAEYLPIVDHRALNLVQGAIVKGWPMTALRLQAGPDLALSASVFGALSVLGPGLELLRTVLHRQGEDAAGIYAAAVLEALDLQPDEDDMEQLADITLRIFSRPLGGSVRSAWELSEWSFGQAWPNDFDLQLAAAAHTCWMSLAAQLEIEASETRQEVLGYVARSIAANTSRRRELP